MPCWDHAKGRPIGRPFSRGPFGLSNPRLRHPLSGGHRLRFAPGGCLPVVASLLPHGTAADAAFGPTGLYLTSIQRIYGGYHPPTPHTQGNRNNVETLKRKQYHRWCRFLCSGGEGEEVGGVDGLDELKGLRIYYLLVAGDEIDAVCVNGALQLKFVFEVGE